MTAPTAPNPTPIGEWQHCQLCGESLNYEPNPVLWLPGAIVLHDADAKKPEMLMVVESATEHEAKTRYLQPDRHTRLKTYINPMCALHDPARWGISTETRQQSE